MSHPNVTRDVLLPPVCRRGMLKHCLAIDHVRAARDHLTSAVGILQGLIKGWGWATIIWRKMETPTKMCVCGKRECMSLFFREIKKKWGERVKECVGGRGREESDGWR